MKKLIPFLLMLIVALNMSAQKKTYSNVKEGFSFTYPSSFHQINPSNAPHMLFEIESSNLVLGISKWNYKVDPSRTIWDEDLIQASKANIQKSCVNKGMTLNSFDKKYVKTASGTKKCLVIVTSYESILHIVCYQFLHKGTPFQISITGNGKCNKQLLKEYDGYVSGLTLK